MVEQKFVCALKTDADLRQMAVERRSAMTDDVIARDYLSRTFAPFLDRALGGLRQDDGGLAG